MAIKLEKNIIVGRALKAKFISPTWKPTLGTNDSKRKFPPASEKLINLLIALSKKPKTGFPKGVLSMKIANNHCNPNPQSSIRLLIFDLLFDNKKAIDKSIIIPSKPVSYSIII